jgi:mannose-6-phosphate isomerase-like protein (cupin superfamily)
MVPEAELEQTEAGLVPASVGWFVMNARDARWFHRPGRDSLPLTGDDEFEAETYFPMLGMSIQVLVPGEPNSMYHWETEQEDFLVLSGEALLIVEGQERPLKQWDFVHCPPETRHVFVGAGNGACVILAASSRQFQASGPWGFYRSTRPPVATTPVPTRRRRTATSRTQGSLRRTRRATATACYRTSRASSISSTPTR